METSRKYQRVVEFNIATGTGEDSNYYKDRTILEMTSRGSILNRWDSLNSLFSSVNWADGSAKDPSNRICMEENMTTIINKKQIIYIEDRLTQVISIINNQKQKEIPKFFSYLLVMNKNIKMCIESDYDGIGELGRYLCEDWMMACKMDCGLGTWYIKDDNIDIKAVENRKFDQAILEIDKLLKTNYIMARTWYDSNDLRDMELSFNKCKDYWYDLFHYSINKYGLLKSEISVIPDDIWTYAKCISIAPDSNSLINWFSKEIPAFGYLAPLEIVKLVNGENILRCFMLSVAV